MCFLSGRDGSGRRVDLSGITGEGLFIIGWVNAYNKKKMSNVEL